MVIEADQVFIMGKNLIHRMSFSLVYSFHGEFLVRYYFDIHSG